MLPRRPRNSYREKRLCLLGGAQEYVIDTWRREILLKNGIYIIDVVPASIFQLLH